MVKPEAEDTLDSIFNVEEKNDAKVNCFDSNFGCCGGFECS